LLLLLLLLTSETSSSGIKGIDADKGGDGICKVGMVLEATLVSWECKGIGIEDW
jgi:hypothetical protein